MPKRLTRLEDASHSTPTEDEIFLLASELQREMSQGEMHARTLHGIAERIRVRPSPLRGGFYFDLLAVEQVECDGVVAAQSIASAVGARGFLGVVGETPLSTVIQRRNAIITRFLELYERGRVDGRKCWRRKNRPAPARAPTQAELPLDDKVDRLLSVLDRIKHLSPEVQSLVAKEVLR